MRGSDGAGVRGPTGAAMDDRQLQWIAHNRRWRPAAEPIADVLKRELRRAPLKVPRWRSRVAGVLAEVTDGTFAEHTWLASLRAGVVTLHVDDAALVGVLRMQWHRALVDLLSERLPDLGIVDVRFRLGPAPGPAGRGRVAGADRAADEAEG